MPRLRLVVLVSGRGTNLGNLLDASRDGRMDADIALVVSNKEDAPALDIAKRAGTPTTIVPSKGVERAEHEARIMDAIEGAGADLVVLAGYMRVLTGGFIKRYQGRLVNIHPSLLPAFPGLDAQGQAARAGVRIAGCTTHFVTEDVDAGPVIMQAAVPLPPACTPEEAAARILRAEHRIYPATIQLIATGKARLHEGRAEVEAQSTEGALISPEAPQ